MKNFKKVLALVLAVVMLLSFATVASAKIVTSDWYEDSKDIDYTEAVDVLGSIGVLNGFPDDTFRPDATITRAQAAKIIAMFDNGSASINGLYASANPFTDCVGHWAESYIAYGAKTGIIAGYASGKFLPENNVTGVQFLKMVLVVLGYDAKVEGLEGKNWDVNTLALARRVGLTDSLGVKFNYTEDLTRQEAAVIMLDALRAQTVVYGSALGVNFEKLFAGLESDPVNVNGVLYMTVAGAVQTGYALGEDWGLAEDYAEDAFYRPYRTWKLNGNVIGQYLYPVYAEYHTAYNGCDVLVDLGVAKTNLSTTVTIADLYINGYQRGEDVALKHTLENITVDACDAKSFKSGAQGTLTQVFKVDGEWRITEIDTWLGQVVEAKRVTSNRDGHLTYAYNAKIQVFAESNSEDNHPPFRTSCFDRNDVAPYTADTALSKGEYVLLTYSCKTDAIESVEAAKGVAGTLNGYKMDNYPSQTRIDGTYTLDAVHFHEGYDDSKDENEFGAKVFFYDVYGNVIGMVDPAAGETQYLVIDKLWLDHEDGEAVLYADVVGLDAKVIKKVTVSSITGAVNGAPQAWNAEDFAKWNDAEYAFVNVGWCDSLRTYGINGSGAYVIGNTVGTPVTDVTLVKGDPNVYNQSLTSTEFAIDAATKFLIHEVDGSYTAVTGFRSIDSMFAAKAEYVDVDNDTIAEIVYLKNVIREGNKFTAYVSTDPTTWVEVDDNGNICYKMTVYVNGVATDVYVDDDEFTGNGVFAGDFAAGFYQFQYQTLAKKNYVDVIATPADLVAENTEYTVKVLNGQILKYIDGAGKTYYDALADDVVFYSIRIDTTVQIEKAEYSDMVPGSRVYLTKNGAGEISEIYVIENIEY